MNVYLDSKRKLEVAGKMRIRRICCSLKHWIGQVNRAIHSLISSEVSEGTRVKWVWSWTSMKVFPPCNQRKKKKSARKSLMLAEILYVCPVSKIMECQGDEESKANWFLEEGNLSGRQRASAT